MATGVAQSLFLLLLVVAAGAAASWGFEWITTAPNPFMGALAALEWATIVLVGWEVAAIIGKWVLVGRLRPRRLRLWSLAHFRFWAASLLVRSAPAARLVGSEWQRWHLNACGARIGAGTLLLCRTPAAPDLIQIGPHVLIGERTLVSGYRPAPGMLVLDRVRIGAGAVIGDDCVVEPGSSLGDHCRLASSTSLQPGQEVPSGQSWHGSPARPLDAELPPLPQLVTTPQLSGPARRLGDALIRLVSWTFAVAILTTAAAWLAGCLLTEFFPAQIDGSAAGLAMLLVWAVVVAAALLLTTVIVGIGLSVLPRALSGLIEDSRAFPLPGGRWSALRLIRACANLQWFNALGSGSVLAARRLRLLGWRLRQRPGSFEAFGERVGQANPAAVIWGSGSVAGDRLWIANVEYSVDAFRVHPIRVGSDCAIGDQVSWPSGARVGDGCQIAPRTALPLSGPLRIRTSLIGSPAAESERIRSERSEWGRSLPELYRQLADRVRADLATMGLQLLVAWVWLTIALAALAGLATGQLPGWLVGALVIIGAALIRWACWLGAEAVARVVTPARPVTFAIRDPRFSRHHRVRRLGLEPPRVLAGTALRPLWWRLRGAQVGACVFDDGASLSEPSLVRIGAGVALGRESVLQTHQTKGAAYSLAGIEVADRTVLGNRSLLLPRTHLGADSQVGADSVLFGQMGAAGQAWLGNPAVPTESLGDGSSRAEPSPADPAIVPVRSPRPTAARSRRAPAVRAPQKGSGRESSPSMPRERTKPKRRSRADTSGLSAADNSARPVAAWVQPQPTGPTRSFALLGTNFAADQFTTTQPGASIAVLSLTDTPLRELNLPQALAGFGIPEECLEDDLSLRDAPISTSAEIRSLLARVLLRQLLSDAHPEHEPAEWGFIRSTSGGLRPFWPTTEEWISLGRSDAVVVAAIASGPIGVAVAAESDQAWPVPAQWLSPDESAWLAGSPEAEARSNAAKLAAVKSAALKAVSEFGTAAPTELDTITEPAAVRWQPQGEPEQSLAATIWPVQADGVQHWIAVVGPAGGALGEDDVRGVDRDGGN